MTTHILETPEVDLAYDVHGQLPTAHGRPPLVMIGQPMDASGFGVEILVQEAESGQGLAGASAESSTRARISSVLIRR